MLHIQDKSLRWVLGLFRLKGSRDADSTRAYLDFGGKNDEPHTTPPWTALLGIELYGV